MRHLICAGLMCVALGVGVASLLAAQPAVEKDVVTLTPEREAAAMTFAGRHHPELAELLQVLKKMDEHRYAVAINDLFQTSERLAKTQSRSVERYEHDLELWKLDSRIRLLAAQSVSGIPELKRAELKRLLLMRQELKIQQLQAERVRLAARIEKIDASISDCKENGEEQAEKELERLMKSVKSAKGKAAATPTAK